MPQGLTSLWWGHAECGAPPSSAVRIELSVEAERWAAQQALLDQQGCLVAWLLQASARHLGLRGRGAPRDGSSSVCRHRELCLQWQANCRLWENCLGAGRVWVRLCAFTALGGQGHTNACWPIAHTDKRRQQAHPM